MRRAVGRWSPIRPAPGPSAPDPAGSAEGRNRCPIAYLAPAQSGLDRILGGGTGAVFTRRQRWRLDRIADVIAASAGVSANDFDNALFAERGGVDGAVARRPQ